MKLVGKKLRVLHFPQVPCKPFIVEVKDEYEAKKIIKVLAEQHLWLFNNNFIPDYSNIITVEMWENDLDPDENGEKWCDYWNDDECMDWDEIEEALEE